MVGWSFGGHHFRRRRRARWTGPPPGLWNDWCERMNQSRESNFIALSLFAHCEPSLSLWFYLLHSVLTSVTAAGVVLFRISIISFFFSIDGG